MDLWEGQRKAPVCVLTRAAAMDALQQLVDESPNDSLLGLLWEAIEDGYETLEPPYPHRVEIRNDSELLARLHNLRQRNS